MRTRILALIAGAACCATTALVAVQPAQADTRPPVDQNWVLCTDPTDDYCLESAQRKTTGAYSDTFPGTDQNDGDVIRDFPWLKFAHSRAVVFGAWKDVNGTGNIQDNSVDPAYTYKLVARTGTFNPREMSGNVKNATYDIDHSVTGGWRFTLEFAPTNVHHFGVGPGGCSVNGSCVSDTTNATFDVAGFATGSIEDLIESGMPIREVIQRTGMFRVTNAQDEEIDYDPDTNTLLVKLANPHLNAAGTQVTDGHFTAFLPNAYLTGQFNVPDPSSLTAGSFTVKKTYGTGSVTVPIAVTPGADGVRIQIDPISFSKPTYKVRPNPSVPGKPRLTGVTKLVGGMARSTFQAPLANGGATINNYQARCHKAGGAWKYKLGTTSPITVSALPPGVVYCQVRAHNVIGWGLWGKAGASRVG